jgi:hypothetical protein
MLAPLQVARSYHKEGRILTFIPLGWLVEEKHNVLGVILSELLRDINIWLQTSYSLREHLHQLTSMGASCTADPRWEAKPSFDEVPCFPAH